jgi:flagellar hook-length control protein FliK
LESSPGLNFGEVLSKQLKGAASRPEQIEDVGLSLGAAKEGVDFGAALAKQLKGAASRPEQIEDVALSLGAVKEGVDFGAALAKQLKGVASRLEQKEGEGLSLVADKEDADPAANSGAAVLPVDSAVLAASVQVPALFAPPGSGAGFLAETGAEKPLMRSAKAGEIRLTAEIAANGKNLPHGVPPEQAFADKLAAFVEVPAVNAASVLHSADLSAATAAFRNSDPLPSMPVAPRVGSAEWGGAVGEKIVWMANQKHQVAELHLNPPNLGPLEVRLTISNDQASALFVSPHSAVREAIETALPRLREMLADSGIMLGNATVGSESFSQQQASEQRNAKEGSRNGPSAEGVMARMAVPVGATGRVRDGMVDVFA